METYKILLDTKGSDKGAATMVEGAAAALKEIPELSIALCGDGEWLAETVNNMGLDGGRVEIINAPGEITNYDDPASAIFSKTDSSMLVGLSALGERDDIVGMLTAGNTGVLIGASVRYISAKDRVRPALAAVLPAANGSFTCLVDAGATVDCTPAMLLHFAKLGTDLMRNMYAIESPRVGLLSNGAEPTKGNKLVKETHLLLKDAEDLNFVGNVEGNTALSGVCDVLVCDGFAGNQILKVTEGTAARIITDIVKYAKKKELPAVMELAGHLMAVYDISSLGGGILLGCKRPVIKLRGSAEASAVVNTARMLVNIAKNKAVFDTKDNKI